jgi:hypothetical protein
LDLKSARPATELAVLPLTTRPTMRVARCLVAVWPGGNCLRRCLLLGNRLRKLDPVLRIGVRRDEHDQFAAHSWLEIDGRTLDPSASAFHVLAAPRAR